jgi:hypothetical protein
MAEAAWCIFNLIVGIPVAVVVVGLCRECLRALFALAFGFRVFEMKWGAGRRVWAKPIGPVEFVLGALPLVGSTIAESGSPKHHHIARLTQASGPILIQLAGVFWGGASGLMFSEALQSGFAPIATLQLANILLIGLHGLIPFETKSGFRTDIRSILDVGFGRAEMNRHARASYYARYARHWLERADVERAKAALGQGLTQLGRDSLLVACEARILAEDLSSVVDQSECADDLRVLIEDAEPRRRKARDAWSVRERVRQATITSLPLVLAALGLFTLESERLSRLMHHRLIVTGDVVASNGIASVCESQLTRWRRWSPVLDLVGPDDPGMERDRHHQLARLERCRGRLEAATAHQRLAISAAQQALTQHASRADADPDLWLVNEVRLTILLRHAAELDTERSRYRLALVALERAAKQLDLAQYRVKRWREPEFQARASGFLESEKAQIELARLQVLTRMGARSRIRPQGS